MRPVHHLVHARTRSARNYALMPLEGYPASRLPTFPDATIRILASPAIGATFAQYLIDLPAGKIGGFSSDFAIETFYFVLAGTGKYGAIDLTPGSFGLVPPTDLNHFHAADPLRLLVLRKRYQPAPKVPVFQAVHGQESDVPKQVWADNPHALLQTLIPDEFAFDLAMNIFTFDPGFGLPIVETHVMQHGLFFLQGKGLYFLGDEWMEVEKDDFIWMGPYCPQSFYATGPTAARYLYFKDVNRDVTL